MGLWALWKECGPFCLAEWAISAETNTQFCLRVALFSLASLPLFLIGSVPWIAWRMATD